MNDYSTIADLYDAYVTETGDLPFWSRWASRASGSILELAAGTGRVTAALREASAMPVVALDRSAAMLRRLRTRFAAGAVAVGAVEGDLTSLPFPSGSFGLVVIPFNSLGEVVEERQREAALAELRRVLTVDGRAVVTLHNPAFRRGTLDGGVHRLGAYALGDRRLEVWVLGHLVSADVAESVQTYRVLDEAGRLVEERRLTLRFALPDAAALTTMARGAGLETHAVYGDYDEKPYDSERSRYIVAVLRRARTAPVPDPSGAG
jgi:ubiquinone/menaquinone biosynthesis C-methylase UbiE